MPVIIINYIAEILLVTACLAKFIIHKNPLKQGSVMQIDAYNKITNLGFNFWFVICVIIVFVKYIHIIFFDGTFEEWSLIPSH
jgi:hypothetical protein